MRGGLLTYNEIVSMATAEWYPWTSTIAELNTNASDYYTELSDWWHLSIRPIRIDAISYIDEDDPMYTYGIWYSSSTWQIVSWEG